MRLDPARTLLRFWLGVGGGTAAGFAAFRRSVFLPQQPEFQCVTVGALCAGMLALVRERRHPEALALASAYGFLLLVLSPDERWRAGAAGLFLALGVYVVARVFDELAAHGLRFGKFLLTGPLLGGVFVALTPLTHFHELGGAGPLSPLLRELFLGVMIGDGVGLGVELAELLWPATGEAPPVDGPVRS